MASYYKPAQLANLEKRLRLLVERRIVSAAQAEIWIRRLKGSTRPAPAILGAIHRGFERVKYQMSLDNVADEFMRSTGLLRGSNETRN
jgi:hypothetical protein